MLNYQLLPLNQEKANSIRRWLSQPEALLFREQIQIIGLAAQIGLAKVHSTEAEPVAQTVEELRRIALNAQRFLDLIGSMSLPETDERAHPFAELTIITEPLQPVETTG